MSRMSFIAITPVFFFPHEVFAAFPYAPTLEGQYIIKNLVLVSAAIVIGATVRGGAVVDDPAIARMAKRKFNPQVKTKMSPRS